MEAEKGMAMKNNILQTVPAIFNETVDKNRNRTAMRTKHLGLWQDISWGRYHEQVRCIGSALVSLGLAKGDAACIIGDNCVEWVTADLGIQCMGGVSVGIYATNAWTQVEYVVTHSDAKFLFVENEEALGFF